MNQFAKNLALLIMRVGFSAGMLTHGYPKLQKILQGDMSFGDPLGIGEEVSLILAVFGEFIAPIFVLIGFKARYAAIPTIITMAVAAFISHGGDPFSKWEKALLYLVGFAAIALLGSGKYSVDGK